MLAQLGESNVVPIVDSPNLSIIPVSLATDGIAIKPGLQFDTRVKNLVGLLFPVDINYVKVNPSPKPETLKRAFVTEVNCQIVNCGSIRTTNRLRYHQHFKDSKREFHLSLHPTN